MTLTHLPCRITLLLALMLCFTLGAAAQETPDWPVARLADGMQKRWLFVWQDMTDPAQVDRVIARMPAAAAAGYNGVAFPYSVAPDRAAALRETAAANGLDLIAIVMGGAHDRNYMEGVAVKDALFVVENGVATLRQDHPTKPVNTDFEACTGNRFTGWGFQDDEGVTTFADHQVVHGGETSLRMESVGLNEYRHCRIAQPIKLQPWRHYRISFWLKTQDLVPADAEIKVLTTATSSPISFQPPNTDGAAAPQMVKQDQYTATISFQTFHTDRTQDWKHYDLVFNSREFDNGYLYIGSWWGKDGKMWWDDITIEEIGLVNVLRRPGCPVTVRGEDGTEYEEGRDYQRIVDPQLHPWIAFHEEPPIRLTQDSRITDGQRLRVSYYHPIIVYEDRLTGCITEPRIFEDWRKEIQQADDLLHPAAFLMSHDEMRVMNQCALCQSMNMTPGQLLAANVHQAAQIIRDVRPDAEIWVWNDMFDPMHNAVDHYYAVNGTLAGSWEGLDPGIGIVNWHGGLKGANCGFFADRGLKQILSGYYDGDEDGSGIAEWLAATKGIPGIVGAMYTTWEDRYDAMAPWAEKAWGSSRTQTP